MVQIDVESENGWQPPDLRPGDPRLAWYTVPGTTVSLQLQVGIPATFLLAVAADFHAYIEPLRDADSASYTDGNSVYTSNHKNATAEDLNWDSHDFEVRGTFTADQQATIRQMVDFYEGWIFWAGDWDDPVDEMHWQMGYNTWGRDADAAEFIARKIRPDGFSTFRRADVPGGPPPVVPPPPAPAPAGGAAQVLYDAIPVIDQARAAELVPLIVPALAAAECTNPRRIAMYLAQYGHESGGFIYTEEIQKDGPGWTWDRKTYLGRTWCQITWQSNYAEFSQWCYDRGLVESPTYFVDNPAALADTKWAALGPAWWTVVKMPQLNEFADAGNIEDASKAINAPAWIGNPNLHANGIEDRTARYEQAIALGDRLLTLITTTHEGDDFMPALSEDEQREVLFLLREIAGVRRESRSRLRWPHQGPVDTCAGFAWNGDAFGHEASVETSAVEDGHPVAIANLYAVINTDEPGREADIEFAKRILARVPQKYITAAQAAIQTWLDAAAAFNGVVTP